MSSKAALVDYRRCSPAQCEKGICTAAEACQQKLLVQESPYDVPMATPSACRACGDCVRACPMKAIRIMPL